MWSAPESTKFRPQRRPTLELGMTPLIDIVFLLLIFFMLTSRFVIQEGIQVDLPVTDRSHTLPAERTHRITLRSGEVFVMEGRVMTVKEMERYLWDQDPAFFEIHFELLADRSASVQAVISLLEMLRDRGASRITLGTERSGEK